MSKWKEITKEAYMQKVAGLKPIASFSDPDGSSPIGNGYPYMETIWGINIDTPIVLCEMRKQHRDQLEWDTKYFEN